MKQLTLTFTPSRRSFIALCPKQSARGPQSRHLSTDSTLKFVAVPFLVRCLILCRTMEGSFKTRPPTPRTIRWDLERPEGFILDVSSIDPVNPNGFSFNYYEPGLPKNGCFSCPLDISNIQATLLHRPTHFIPSIWPQILAVVGFSPTKITCVLI